MWRILVILFFFELYLVVCLFLWTVSLGLIPCSWVFLDFFIGFNFISQNGFFFFFFLILLFFCSAFMEISNLNQRVICFLFHGGVSLGLFLKLHLSCYFFVLFLTTTTSTTTTCGSFCYFDVYEFCDILRIMWDAKKPRSWGNLGNWPGSTLWSID